MVPSAEGQARAIRRACAAAELEPAELGFVELHGTGTRVGDSVEAGALLRVFGQGATGPVHGPARRRLLVGSIKTTTGHLEGAAGLLGLVKAVLVARHGVVPGTAGHLGGALVRRLAEANIAVPAGAVPLRDGASVGVSSVGMGGTNCHVVLAAHTSVPSAPEPTDRVSSPTGVSHPGTTRTTASTDDTATAGTDAVPVPILLSATSAESLRLGAAALAEWAATPNACEDTAALTAVARTLATRRATLPQRCGFTVRDTGELRERLRTIADGERDRAIRYGVDTGAHTAFLFPGQGSQRPGMGSELYRRLPSFARHFDLIAAVADPLMEVPLHRVVFGPSPTGEDADALVHATQYTQIALFAVGVALYHSMSESGVAPDAVAGHSVGELAAAHTAGVLSLPDAVRLVLARGTAMAKADPDGVMVAVEASEDEVRAVLVDHPGTGIAAVNGPAGTVVSGDREATLACAGVLRDRGHRTRVLKVAHAFHSHHMDAVLDEFRAVAADIDYGLRKLPVVSNVTGALATGDELRTAEYWVDHIRRTVRFGDCLDRLADAGTSLFLELGPGATLTAMVRGSVVRTVDRPEGAAVAAGSLLGDGSDEYGAFLDALVLAHVRGQEIDWAGLPGLGHGDWAALPTYRFTGRRYWPGMAGVPAVPAVPATVSGVAPAVPAVPTTPGGDLLGLVLGTVAEVLGVRPAHSVNAMDTLADLGMTSLLGLELRAELAARTGLELPTSLVYDHPTPAALAAHLSGPKGPSAQRTVAQHRPKASPVAIPRMPSTDVDDDPVVIAAMACRYPGEVTSPQELWELAVSDREVLSDFPEDRGPAWSVPGPHPRHGGFLADVAGFDAAHFGISPREARAMDPQQRIVLELCWEALERAGCDPRSLHGQSVGVFLGAMAGDYATAARESGDDLGGHELTGASNAVLSGRVSYQLGLTGPALTVDTACSSSLVAVHLAAGSLLRGECDLALAGGVTVMSTPKMFQEFQRLGGLAADGRCRAFAAAADGTVWSEGAGVIVVARRSEARRRGLRVLATVRGSAVNQDGASNGLTAPNGSAQRQVIARALADAGLRVEDVDVVEAHGTGTVLGDSVEAQAVIDTYGVRDEATAPILLRSLKSVIGHTQAAAGVGGLIAMVTALHEERLPATRYADTPTPKVEWPQSVRLLERSVAWPRGRRTRRAAISSFGMSGTNAHLVIEEPGSVGPQMGHEGERADRGAPTVLSTAGHHPIPRSTESAGPVGTPSGISSVAPLADDRARPREAGASALPFIVSAGDRTALRAQLGRLRTALADGKGPVGTAALSSTALTLATRRAALPYRASIVAGDRSELLAGLDAALRGEVMDQIAFGEARGDCAVAFVFPGQGSQWAGMARGLLRESRVFADTVAACSDAFAPYIDFSVPHLLSGADDTGRAESLEGIQVSLFVTMAGLVDLWRAAGVVPDLVLGHSQGEVAAAYAAGALDLKDAARVVAIRARLLSRLSGSGAMAVIGLDESRARKELAKSATAGAAVEVAAVNGPGSTVVSGPVEAVGTLVDRLAAAGVRTATVAVDYASHSAMVEPVEAELKAALAGISPRRARTPFFSTTRAAYVDGTELDAAYWYENLRGEVHFARSVAAVAGSRRTAFIEVSPHEVLTSPITATLDGLEGGADTIVLGSLRRESGSYGDFLSSLSSAWTRGVPVGWTADTFGGPIDEPVDLPPTPFAHRRFWIKPSTVTPVPPSPATDPSAAAIEVPARIIARPVEEIPTPVELPPDTTVLTEVARVLHLTPADTEERSHHTFTELGLDSLTTVDLRRRLRDALGITVPVQVFGTHNTPSSLAQWVQHTLTGAASSPPTNTPHHGDPADSPTTGVATTVAASSEEYGNG
ncbi:acyltransferase domain-containing protein [Streptomyces sp. NPDC059130]|uniref:acyltransferase domain-containing protein n=1 Tax=Streptomyces sp. NPDC059130 TaxID=3346735 RepID=UPI00368D3454